MRVITGSAKGRQLKVPKANTTRPMTDLVKGALFNMLGPLGIVERRALDLYAGSGSIGIEALSRGAASCHFVEQNAAACVVIDQNLATTRFQASARLSQATVGAFLARLKASPPPEGERFDLVFLDPPYAAPDIDETIATLAESPALTDDAIIVVGHAARRPLPDQLGRARRLVHRCHGDSCFSFYTTRAEVPAVGAEESLMEEDEA